MQSASSNFSAAISGSSVTWAAPMVYADWAQDGYGPAGTIDDLSSCVGAGWTVTHALDDGMPSDVHDQTADPLGQLTAPLASGPTFPAAAAIGTRQVANTSNAASGGSTTITMSAPPDLVIGDRMVLAVTLGSTTPTITAPAGWTLLYGPVDRGATIRSVAFSRAATSADIGATYTVTLSVATVYSAALMALYATGHGTPTLYVEASGAVAELTSVSPHTTPTLTTGARQTVLLGIWSHQATTFTWTAPAGDSVLGESAGVGTTAVDLMVTLSPVVTASAQSRTATTSAPAQVVTSGLVAVSVYVYQSRTGNAQSQAAEYFSQVNTSSPISGYDRDIPPVKLDYGLVTASGVERVRLFTGAMADIPVSTKSAQLQGVSATNRAMQKLVQPPPIYGDHAGLTGSWPISWALAQCGVYVSPPPRAGCRYWAPLHGSLTPFSAPADTTKPSPWSPGSSVFDLTDNARTRPQFVRGPFLDGVYALGGPGAQAVTMYTLDFAAGADFLSKAGSAGRVEFWVRGDALDVNTTPGGSGTTGLAAGVRLANGPFDVGLGQATVGVDMVTRKAYVKIDDGATHIGTLASTATLPTDGGWYFVGGAYNFSTRKLWITNTFTGTPVVETTTVAGIITTFMPLHDFFHRDNLAPFFISFLPAAELQITSGPTANPDNFPWINSAGYFTPGAIGRPSQNGSMQALAEPAPIRAIDLISRFAQAELAMTRCDELDRFNFLPLSYWVESAQQTQVQTLTTTADISDLAIGSDLTRIRNSVAASYTQTTVNTSRYLYLYQSSPGTVVKPGVTTLQCPFTAPTVFLETDVQYADFATIATILTAGLSYLTANSAADGSGTNAPLGWATITITAWTPGGCTLQIVNASGRTWYLVNDSDINQPAVGIAGWAVQQVSASVMASDPGSIATRGERGMTISLPGAQDQFFALSVADALTGLLCSPRRRITNLAVHGDPRRQPGDLVRIRDQYGTTLDGLYRIMAVAHKVTGATYEQTITAIQAWQVAVWDGTTWGAGVWGA